MKRKPVKRVVKKQKGGISRRNQPPTSPAQPADWLVRMFGGQAAAAGTQVNEYTAGGWTPLMSGLRFLAETHAGLPVKVNEKLEPRGHRPLPDHPIAKLYRHGPNPDQTWFEFAELSQTHAILWGNAYAQIVWNGMMEPVQLWPFNPDRVQVKRDRAGKIFYEVSLPGDDVGSYTNTIARIPAEDMLHVRGFTRYGLIGERLASIHRETIGLGLATIEFASRFFSQGAQPSGVLQHPGKLTAESAKRLRDSFDKQATGVTNAHRTVLLEEGMEWKQTTVDPEKAQFVGLLDYNVQEASRILRIPPHLLYDLSRATFTNIEHQGIEVVVYSLLPWARRWESRLNKTLISEKMKNRVSVTFVLDGLLRGDIKSRYDAYAVGITNGWLSQDDVRELEHLNPIPEGKGQTYLQPANLVPLGTKPKAEPKAANPADMPMDPEPIDEDALEEVTA